MKKASLVVSVMLVLSGCSAPKDSGMVGADKDEHGCIGSAGYAWCASTNQCERSWELAKDKGFENTQESFNAFCAQ
ncbi:serine protease [Enterovibrio sp. ZSDZ35]|uniref:Serine protease n=1 Tax=Enterovibrio qingdaonensis TaxID=2899818 RepID=A0ABT5QJY4_9GAMM|nr:serine protease [Enterovibrio sp. ZSDZ35]MDD1780978.1 serine protease [Enterovibrio sp. ZSDZ35]